VQWVNQWCNASIASAASPPGDAPEATHHSSIPRATMAVVMR
jgi:hypothetical protein